MFRKFLAFTGLIAVMCLSGCGNANELPGYDSKVRHSSIELYKNDLMDKILSERIYKATSDAINSGAIYYFVLAASLSLNVGIFNLIPIPALDGGRIVLTLIEAIIRRPISKKVESYIIGLSYALFLLLFIYVTGQDLFKLFR